jgi:hypothetical protein
VVRLGVDYLSKKFIISRTHAAPCTRPLVLIRLHLNRAHTHTHTHKCTNTQIHQERGEREVHENKHKHTHKYRGRLNHVTINFNGTDSTHFPHCDPDTTRHDMWSISKSGSALKLVSPYLGDELEGAACVLVKVVAWVCPEVHSLQNLVRKVSRSDARCLDRML